MRSINHREASERLYDVVIVGSGISGAVLAKQMDDRHRSVLLIEAGEGKTDDFNEFESYQNRFYQAEAKIPNAPFPTSHNAPQPLVTDAPPTPIQAGESWTKGYYVQRGPQPFGSTFTQRTGGTTLHWLGSCPRMLPEDFELQSRYGVGRDWPVSYEALMPYYAKAEEMIGVSADVEDQAYAGISFESDYVYPMHKIPQSYLDQWVEKGLRGMTEKDDNGNDIAVDVVSIPQARNSIPNRAYANGKGYQTVGAVGNPAIGHRCMGNSSCIPICPTQARYSSWKTFHQTSDHVSLVSKAVAFDLEMSSETGRVNGVRCKVWFDDQRSEHEEVVFRGTVVVLAANAIKNAVLLLGAGVANRSNQVGRNLMDHPAILSWGLAPENIGAFRGPGLTSVIPAFRAGAFRKERAAFEFEIGNWGWSWPKDEPTESVNQTVDEHKLYGKRLRQQLGETLPRQIRVDLMTEQLPVSSNRVTVDAAYVDPLGVYRPVIHYDVDSYSQLGMVFGRKFTERIFQRLGIHDYTEYDPGRSGYFEYDNQGYSWNGVGHLAGTHVMGTDPTTSVVDHRQRSWEHDNLYIVGCGSFPTMGTANPTLTMTALNIRTAEFIDQQLHS